ncbi:ubiquinone menaquinone biosynthesis C-methyltransferase [Podospora australis]|uniref:Ubiquinone menaquinone biosynthesis C-methyltransferase n=1 Tax=Podospora australis TaxID=1536484 RepID=A0AAN7ANI5_9PEZI|nr:ubiquinone menaquinone biosynthesis C-methyltransferase [Podospora australis]
MATPAELAKKEYDILAKSYNRYSQTPAGIIESQLIAKALGDLTGLHVLDLAGGSGTHAREALSYGAASVDIVDISPSMLAVAASLSPPSVLRTFETDASLPLTHLPLRKEGYDVVMANWLLSFVDSLSMLEGIFTNISTYLKPGGIFVSIRDNDPFSPNLLSGKTGCEAVWSKPLPEGKPKGAQYFVRMHVEGPPIEFMVYTLETIYSGSTEWYEKAGLVDYQTIPYDEAATVKEDPEFWKDFLERPWLAVVRAVKRKD